MHLSNDPELSSALRESELLEPEEAVAMAMALSAAG